MRERRYRPVYIIGAGFSEGLGFPLTKVLFQKVWGRLSGHERNLLQRIAKFHFPNFDPRVIKSFPDIEQLLTQIAVNEELFDVVRPVEGKFKKDELKQAREALLYVIANWFHEIYKRVGATSWLTDFNRKIQTEKATIISFNWDLVLDFGIFGVPDENAYGLTSANATRPTLLKPHGSLNWYSEPLGKHIEDRQKFLLHKRLKNWDAIYGFRSSRPPITSYDRKYIPWIVPPTHDKRYEHPLLRTIWTECTQALSTATHVYFLGYSLPLADRPVRFILRCGFYNQEDGPLGVDGKRSRGTRRSSVIIVNPEKDAVDNIENAIGIHASHIPWKISQWVEKGYPRRG